MQYDRRINQGDGLKMNKSLKSVYRNDITIRMIREISFNCPTCDEEINDFEHAINDEMSCPHCGQDINVHFHENRKEI